MNAVGSNSSPGCRALIFAVAWLSAALSQTIQAQTVDILAADQIVRDPAVTDAQRLLGHVQLGHQDGVLHCDSAWRFDDGVVEVFGHVRMEHPPSTVLLAVNVEPSWSSRTFPRASTQSASGFRPM